jgi:hypothetical protein
MKAYASMRKGFVTGSPKSAEGRAAAKEATAKDMGNISRSAF